MTQENMKKILEIGVQLSAERDFNRLMERILSCMMELTNCDAGTLYLLKEDRLHFRVMRNNTLNTYAGGDGKEPDLPPVPLKRENVCALALLEGKTILVEDVRNCREYDFSGPLIYAKAPTYQKAADSFLIEHDKLIVHPFLQTLVAIVVLVVLPFEPSRPMAGDGTGMQFHMIINLLL